MVPAEAQTENVPCHHIPMNASGETIDSMERQYNQQEMEDAVKNWLKDAITRIEAERAKRATH